ncbi:iron(III) transport system ATP-binding protein [Azospirillum baldaniorum]|uniref:ABC transporter ATP-binding protein n=1 Tax=Azospirillum baldaniorum TaxID=1064539 RepID=UPI0011A0B48B|nr:ABC transporter ATP-binding protein [Azospirillum baldaniorum]TWA57330.1 iron(III) transport system ATP-binding protein [Azospirillum baldaniorum]
MLRITGLAKGFQGHRVLDGLSLSVRTGEIFTLLGASGCGKTTLLRIVAGLETADAGTVAFKDRLWVDAARRHVTPPQRRGIGLVFQSYAVWPHLSVFENVAYPLRNRKDRADAVRARVADMLRIVGLDGLEDRPATQLSGGQQQRVAMARALAPDPELLLLDEPFSNLDVVLRKQLRLELRRIQQRLGLTVVLVTHDQSDAFTLSDRIAVLRDGAVEQTGTPEEIYDSPRTDFVRGFVGRSSALQGVLADDGRGGPTVRLPGGGALPVRPSGGLRVGEPAAVWIRPEEVLLDDAGFSGEAALAGAVRDRVFAGDRYETFIELDGGQTLVAYQPRGSRFEPGRRVAVRLDPVPPAVPPT